MAVEPVTASVCVSAGGSRLFGRSLLALGPWTRDADWSDPSDIDYAFRVSVLVRWVVWVVCAFLLLYRPVFTSATFAPYAVLNLVLLVLNIGLWWWLISGRPVSRPLVLFVFALDMALITGAVVVGGGFQHYGFLAYYPALALFAATFTSLGLTMVWTTVVAAFYLALSLTLGAGVEITGRSEEDLLSRVGAMYTVAGAVSLIVRFQRVRRAESAKRERALQREQVETSQAIHDTAAQSAYMVDLGIDRALRQVGAKDPDLRSTLEATSSLSKSAMWDLRRPIDLGHLLEGRSLSRVLRSHVGTFTTITSVPAEVRQSGVEPELAMEMRVGLFNIAHNALTNAFRHAGASKIEVGLEFGDDSIRLFVHDDGVGLPDDYAERGHGFRGMRSDAEHLGGSLLVESGGSGQGTVVACVVPCFPAERRG